MADRRSQAASTILYINIDRSSRLKKFITKANERQLCHLPMPPANIDILRVATFVPISRALLKRATLAPTQHKSFVVRTVHERLSVKLKWRECGMSLFTRPRIGQPKFIATLSI